MALGDIIQTTFMCRFGEQISVNVRHWRVVTESGSGATLGEIAEVLRSLVQNIYVSLISNAAQWIGTSAQKIFPLPKSVQVFSDNTPSFGGLGEDPLPTQTAGLIGFRTAFAGRSQRGRLYAPFPTEVVNTVDHTPNLAYLVSLSSLGTVLSNNISAGTGANMTGLIPVIFHRATNSNDPILQFRVRPLWATQRRRGAFGRPNPLEGAGVFVGQVIG